MKYPLAKTLKQAKLSQSLLLQKLHNNHINTSVQELEQYKKNYLITKMWQNKQEEKMKCTWYEIWLKVFTNLLSHKTAKLVIFNTTQLNHTEYSTN